jgi:hypothetical protein
VVRKKKTTWSKRQEWDGFRPAAYTLHIKTVCELPVDKRAKNPSGEQGPITHTTVGEAFAQLRDEQINEVEAGLGPGLTVRTNLSEQTFSGASFSLGMLEALLRLHRAGADGFDASWFWYDYDSVTDDPHDSYAFFVVSGDKIVEERISFSDYHGNGFDPTIFSTENEVCPIWFRDNDWLEASVRYWYRKFYTETRTGQLMVLRPDEPELFFYPEGRWAWTSPLVFQGLQTRLQKIYGLLIGLVLIGILALILLWR